MSSQLLPSHVSLRKSVNSRARYVVKIPLAMLSRVSNAAVSVGEIQPELADSINAFSVVLAFNVGENGKPVVQVSVKGCVLLECQRCLQPVQQEVSISSLLTVVKHDEEAKNRLSEVEPLIVNDDSLDIHALLEDEILLSLPIVPMHKFIADPKGDAKAGINDFNVCRPAVIIQPSDNVLSNALPDAKMQMEPSAKTDNDNPFAVLAGLLPKNE